MSFKNKDTFLPFRHCTRHQWCVLAFHCHVSVADPHHFDADTDPDPAFRFDADPDSTFHSDADPDHSFQFDPDPTTHFFPDLDPPMFQNDTLRFPPFLIWLGPGSVFLNYGSWSLLRNFREKFSFILKSQKKNLPIWQHLCLIGQKWPVRIPIWVRPYPQYISRIRILNSDYGSADPDPLTIFTDPEHWLNFTADRNILVPILSH
jgi:hypothetical protein